jgi:beta-glucosidase
VTVTPLCFNSLHNAAAPRPVWTPLNPSDKSSKDIMQSGAKTPMQRPTRPEEIAPAYVFLAPAPVSALALAVIALFSPAARGSAGDSVAVDRLLAALSLQEKIALVHGATEAASSYQGQAGYLPGVPRLGIAPLRLADGPPGVLTRKVSTALPATMALAATFSVADARANGVVIGRDARALGINLVLEPYINIYRDPGFVRSYNTYGEDPLLTGQIGAALIQGIQSQGVMAQAKHYVAFDGANDVQVDPQTLREIYAAPFADAVDAGVASIMCAYSRINGQFACGSDAMLHGLLRDEMGFGGFVTSDWGATHAADFINAGLDLEMPGQLRVGPAHEQLMTSYFSGTDVTLVPSKTPDAMGFGPRGRIPEEYIADTAPVAGGAAVLGEAAVAPKTDVRANLHAALETGSVTAATITQAARRILLQMQRFGLLDRRPGHSLSAEPVAQDARVVLRTEEDGAVLLKNDGALPLSRRDLGSLLLIGPGALQTVAVARANEQALGRPERQIGAVQVLRRVFRNDRTVQISYCPGDDMTGQVIPAGAFSHDGRPGLTDEDLGTGRQAVDPAINFTLENQRALPARSVHRWSGSITVPVSGVYEINLQMLGGSGAMVFDDQPLGRIAIPPQHGDVLQAGHDNVLPTPDGLDNLRRRIELSAGRHRLLVTASGDDSGKPLQVRLNWVTPEQKRADYAAAIAAARSARAVVVFAWSRNEPVLALPGNQNQLIADVAAANSNTIVVLNTGDPVAMPWLGQVRAVLQMWYTGDEGGWAASNLLLGHANPAGRLPFTWPRRLQDTVAHDPMHPERSSGGVDGRTEYSEGLMVGYRWFDQQGIEPLFPFGYGLSYTQFAYRSLAVSRAADGGLRIAFTLTNTGPTRGDEVPQAYLSAPDIAAQGARFARRSLVAFDRVPLAAGQSRRVVLRVPLRRLEYWSEAEHRWRLAAGARLIELGSSSRDIRLTAPAG